MHSHLSFFLATILVISTLQIRSLAKSVPNTIYTLQVASFADQVQAERYAVSLIRAGEEPVLDTVEITGQGFWTRVFVGLFQTADSARRQGVALITRGIIKEFLIKTTDSMQTLTRPRRITTDHQRNSTDTTNRKALADAAVGKEIAGEASVRHGIDPGGNPLRKSGSKKTRELTLYQSYLIRDAIGTPLPVAVLSASGLAPGLDTTQIPRPDPVTLAFKLVVGDSSKEPAAFGQRGGLWVSGDREEGLARLRWIAGKKNANLIDLDHEGRLRFNSELLAKVAGKGHTRVEDPLQAVDYISSNEGLLLLVQVTQGRFRYMLHIGRQVPTLGKTVEIAGSLNLDNNIDSRINPYRKDGRKLDSERPPRGFDALIALNPVARWFNLNNNGWVHPGGIVFHELAESFAKLELNLDYLDQALRPGAHSLALTREGRLKSQRPDADIVTTTGSNRLLRTQQEIRLFTAEAVSSTNQR